MIKEKVVLPNITKLEVGLVWGALSGHLFLEVEVEIRLGGKDNHNVARPVNN